MPIAVVGMGCRFPGDATSPNKLWDLLMRKKSARGEIPADRFNIDAFYHPDGDRHGTINLRGGHFLKEDITAFDAPFFSISPTEAISMDPMQRILLEVVYEATENAGIPMSTLAGSNTSCFVGCFTRDYGELGKRDIDLVPKYMALGAGNSILSNRISFFFDLSGPSLTVDTACSSSLVAVHLACQSLRAGESKTAIVGATNAILSPDIPVELTNMHFLSPDSICYSFDERANGYARGEGMAALILKPLENAIRDGDTIRAVIRGTAVNSDGKTPGITMPSKDAQISLIQSAYKQSGCDPAVTGYFEAHGTGTAAGDPIEASAIGAALGQYRPNGEDSKLYIGSVKTNIGHLEGSSGIAGLIKAVLSVEKGIIAPNLWFEKGNPAIDFDGWRIRVPTESTLWPGSGLRRASVNSFGYGGTNAHVIIDDAYHSLHLRGLKGNQRTRIPPMEVGDDFESRSEIRSYSISDSPTNNPHLGAINSVWKSDIASSSSTSSTISSVRKPRPRVFHLTAHEEEVVMTIAKEYAQHLATRSEKDEGEFLGNLAFTLCERRSLLPWATCMVAATKIELIQKLEALSTTTRRLTEAPRLGFIFTGQGAQWWAMGRELLDYPIFADVLAVSDNVIQNLGASWSLLDELLKDEKKSRINEAAISQPLCTAIQIALVDLYASWNILPARVVGHSSGEIAAAYATGALPLESAVRVAYFRGLVSSNIKKFGYTGSMLAAGISELDAEKEIQAIGDSFGKAVVACVNSSRSVTLSGDSAAITQLQKNLTSRGLFARKLQVDTAYHSHHMLAISEDYLRHLYDLSVIPWDERKSVEMISSVTGQPVTREDLMADYWVKNMVSCVRFLEALEKSCTPEADVQEDGKVAKAVDLLIELGPHSALAGPVKQTLTNMPRQKASPIQYLSALVRGRDAIVSALEVAASLFAQGYPVDMHAAQFPDNIKSSLSVLIDLPSYCWNHKRKYLAQSRLIHDYLFRPFSRTDILGVLSYDYNPIEPRWRNFIRLSEQPWVKSHVVQGAIVYPAAGFCCMAIEAALQMSTVSSTAKEDKKGPISEYKIRDLGISRAIVVPETEEGVEVIFSMRPHPINQVTSSNIWNEFRIFSYTKSGGWAEHCRGLISVVYKNVIDEEGASKVEDDIKNECHAKLHYAKRACGSKLDCSEFYKGLFKSGLSYGPEFRGIVDIAAGHCQAVGTVQVTDTRSAMPKEFEFDRLVHPATMDAFLQVSSAALCEGDINNISNPYVPTFIQEISVSGSITSTIGRNFQVLADLENQSFHEVISSIVAFDQDRLEPVVRIDGFKCMALAASGSGALQSGAPKHCVSAIWEPDVDLISKENLDRVLRESLKGIPSRTRGIELLAYYFTDQLLQEIKETEFINMLPHHQKFFRYLQHQREMVLCNTHEQQTDERTRLEELDVSAKIKLLIQQLSGDTNYEGRMLLRMGQALPSILRQEVEPLELMMQDSLLQNFYSLGIGSTLVYPQMARYITILSHKYPNLEYLEIGAGTGGATVPVLQALSRCGKHKYPRFKSYTCTDISTGFSQSAERFSDLADFMEFKKLDIEQDPDKQGFKDKQFDVILAANVLHTMYDINRAMAHVRKLLRPGGKLILLDMTNSLLWVSLIFGNLPGWWRTFEPWRKSGPLLDENEWRDTLQKHGFSDLQVSSPDVVNPSEHCTRLMIATAVEQTIHLNGINGVNGHAHSDRAIIVRPKNRSKDNDEFIRASETALNNAGVLVEIYTLSELQNRDLAGVVCISFAELEDALLPEITPSDFEFLQRLTQQSAGLLWVTRGGISKGTRPELSLFQGLARSLRTEQESFPCFTIDLDAEHKLPANQVVDLLISTYKQTFGSRQAYGVADHEFSEENGVLRIKRAVHDSVVNQYIAARTKSMPLETELQDIWQVERPFKLRARTLGALNSLVFDDDPLMREPLPEDQVEIEVHAVGLNYRDVLISMGELSDNYLGNECAGIITKVGTDVHHLIVGDRVASWGIASFKTKVRNFAICVQRIPDKMSFSVAASLPLAYVTAYHGVIDIAHLSKGETILIHAGAGGVGQAAIQIATMIGAEIFVT
ncbi:hypothetical protein Egran_06595, partial [Elaphomyces granulatus]